MMKRMKYWNSNYGTFLNLANWYDVAFSRLPRLKLFLFRCVLFFKKRQTFWNGADGFVYFVKMWRGAPHIVYGERLEAKSGPPEFDLIDGVEVRRFSDQEKRFMFGSYPWEIF